MKPNQTHIKPNQIQKKYISPFSGQCHVFMDNKEDEKELEDDDSGYTDPKL